VYTPVGEGALQEKLGTAEYSYFFVMKGFLPILAELGEVIHVNDPEVEADPLYRDAVADGEQCRLVCFCPPNRAPVGLECPTTVVVAWEFDSLPSIPWDDEQRNDWRTVLADHGNVISLSTHTRDVVRTAMGEDFPATAMPVPVFDHISDPPADGKQPIASTTISFRGRQIDSRALDIRPDGVELTDPEAFRSQIYHGGTVTFTFEDGGIGQRYLMGFYNAEPWGAWSRTSEPSVLLPFVVGGKVKMTMMMQSHGYNVGRTMTISAGGGSADVELVAAPKSYTVTLDVQRPTNLVSFSGLDGRAYPGTFDIRTMGIGLLSLSLREKRGLKGILGGKPQPPTVIDAKPEQQVELDGVVYTTVLNPQDGRKNWHDIISAFCHAHRDHADATLVLKMTHHAMESFIGEMLTDLRVIGQTACRIVAIHGYLPDEDLRALMAATSFYVNASRGEGLCLPLMEFMSAGVPAIAPDHTAMADYVAGDTTFVVSSCTEPTAWPNDPLMRITTSYRRIDWSSLADQFRASYQVATQDPTRYRDMSRAAVATQAHYSADAVVAEQLARHLQLVDAAEAQQVGS
jgi:hypothetical protein